VAYPMSTFGDLQDTAKAARSLGARVVAASANVRDRESLRAVLDPAVTELERLDVVVANAGTFTGGTWDQIDEAVMTTTLEVNLRGVWNTCAISVPHLLERGGSIICISSSAEQKAQPLALAYTASKHGVTGLARALANELAEHSIRVNSIHPIGVLTGLKAPALHDLLVV